MTLKIVSSTRVYPEEFKKRPLGRSIARLRCKVEPSILYLNTGGQVGLPAVYNEAARLASPDDILVFVHDDVVIGDRDLEATLEHALSQYDVVGVAGGVKRDPGQTTWFGPLGSIEQGITSGRLSGCVPHVMPDGSHAFSVYGPAPREVELLDGVFLATRASSLRAVKGFVETDPGRGETRFDPQFKFHFYDLDFCRTASAAGLSLGTWFIPIIHMPSGDGYDTPSWQAARDLYLKKWETP